MYNEIKEKIEHSDYEGLISFLETQLLLQPENDEIRIRLALLLQSVFIDDYYSALDILDGMLSKNTLNIEAIILKAYIEDTFQGEIRDETLVLIDNSINKPDHQDGYLKQMFILKAYYYRTKDQNLFFESLLDSIKYDPGASLNFLLLVDCYELKGEKKKAEEFLDKAIANIVHVYSDNEYNDVTDFNEFIDEKIRGINLTKQNYESLLSRRKEL